MYQTIVKSIFGELPYKPLVPNYTLFTLTPLLFHGGKGKRLVPHLILLITVNSSVATDELGRSSVCQLS